MLYKSRKLKLIKQEKPTKIVFFFKFLHGNDKEEGQKRKEK